MIHSRAQHSSILKKRKQIIFSIEERRILRGLLAALANTFLDSADLAEAGDRLRRALGSPDAPVKFDESLVFRALDGPESRNEKMKEKWDKAVKTVI